MSQDIDKLIVWARSQGWEVATDADGYRRFYAPGGGYVVRYPATPSNPRRRLLDVVTAVRQHGLPWPPPSKKGAALAAQEGGTVMGEWIVQVSASTGTELDEQTLRALADAAERRDASVSRRAEGPGFTVNVAVDAADPLAAAQDGVRFARDELGADVRASVIDLRVTTPEQFETEAMRPDFPELASAADAAEILGVSRQRVHQLAASNTRFPAPVARVGTGPLWTVPAIEHFAEIWERKPGRPSVPRQSQRIPTPHTRV